MGIHPSPDLVPEPPQLKSTAGKWLSEGGESNTQHEKKPWYAVLWLTGVDYFSTLGYQPGIALLAAGALSPIATFLLVIVTLGGALPIYAEVAKRSFQGQGSIAMLEKLLSGWWSKIFVLILLGFASTDFVITMTLSASDAAEHLVHNPFLKPYIEPYALPITMLLLTLLALVFLAGFSEAVGIALVVGIPYVLLNGVVVVRCFQEILTQPERITAWQGQMFQIGDWTMILLVAGLTFPKLALGLSGFETGVTMMPLVRGDRIKGTQRLLTAAALIMSVLLISSSWVTTLLIPPEAYAVNGPASGRALAYLAHELLGNVFGTIYDISTIAILWFAGASAMAAMLNLIPRYLPRFGMAPDWVRYPRPLVFVLLAINLGVTWIFNASVEAQGGAYATGVLVLIFSAGVAVALALTKEVKEGLAPRWKSYYFWFLTAVFGYTLIENIRERPDGVVIATGFILAVVIISTISRWQRATELRVEEAIFSDEESIRLWDQLVAQKVCLVPLISIDPEARYRKTQQIRTHYTLHEPLIFMHVTLLDDRSDFMGGLRIQVRKVGTDYTLEVGGAVAIANTIAYLSEQIKPTAICLGLTRKNMTTQSLAFLLWGEGETGLMVYQILIRYWASTPHEDERPRIFLMSDGA